MNITRLLEKINTYEDHRSFICDLILNKRPIIVSFLNAHAVNLSFSDKNFFNFLMKSDFLLRDGVGIKIACFLHSINPKYNLNGTDLIPSILKKFSNKKLSVYGSRKEILEIFCQKHKKKFNIVSAIDGFCDSKIYLKDIKENDPQIILLGMGMPKQEYLSFLIKNKFSKHELLIINGGAIIDFMSGQVSRAPAFLRMIGFEWFFRLYKEPRRLFKRYVIGNISFLIRIFLNLIK